MKWTETLWAVRTKAGKWRGWSPTHRLSFMTLFRRRKDAEDWATVKGDGVVRVTATYEVVEP